VFWETKQAGKVSLAAQDQAERAALLLRRAVFLLVPDRADIRGSIDNKQGDLDMPTIACPECSADINLESGTMTGEIIVCPDCGVDLEVVSLKPPAVELAPMEQEDWGE